MTLIGFPWEKVPAYILAQIVGGWVGAGIVYANYHRAIDIFEGGSGIKTVPGTASLFATFPLPYLSNGERAFFQAFFQELLATALLVVMVLAATDRHNSPPPKGLVPLILLIAILGISACFGMQTSFALNPARDLGPRLMCWMTGYGRNVWNHRSQYWLYGPIIGPIVGALAGTALYDLLIFTGPESIFNQPYTDVGREPRHANGAATKGVPFVSADSTA
ncbi:hypothetical protein FRC09_004196 [Ceratobasidium sp. 395]|nr:hypothetical protein FRC09_004196 [Ceratobasidium sp. 395]